ncbi:hypothetical protein [Micromonospora sp. U21]|uniref:hypothetical protein n=1 Tax=Micromonospora sp. U21 TaxID=2824899 RepID=UPI001B399170|nr:hypothetical protein [Micromonospora sp. U21]MBQ0906371.1 hypothetical protein [Micromonospora sp. U21]
MASLALCFGFEPVDDDQQVKAVGVDVVGFAAGQVNPGDACGWWAPGERLVDSHHREQAGGAPGGWTV